MFNFTFPAFISVEKAFRIREREAVYVCRNGDGPHSAVYNLHVDSCTRNCVTAKKKAFSEPCPERNALAHPIDKPFYNTWPSSKPSYNTWPSAVRQSSLATITPSEAELCSCVTCMTSRPYLVSTASSLYKLTVVVRD